MNLISTEKQTKEADSWLKTWKRQKKKALILWGYVGTGKTTLAYQIAEKYNYSVVEFNASDLRNKQFMQKLKKLSLQNSFEPTLILLDEADACLSSETKILIIEKDKIVETSIKKCIKKEFSIISYNFQEELIEEDSAQRIDSGEVSLFEVSFDDGSSLQCSLEQPFFIIKGGKIEKKKLSDISIGEEIIGVSYDGDL